jgi:hypothetical protein
VAALNQQNKTTLDELQGALGKSYEREPVRLRQGFGARHPVATEQTPVVLQALARQRVCHPVAELLFSDQAPRRRQLD